MARYRVGNSYLSEEEYKKHQDNQVIKFLCLVGAVLFGYGCSVYILPLLPDTASKWVKVIMLVLSGCLGAGVFFALRNFILLLIGLAILGALLVMGYVVVESIL